MEAYLNEWGLQELIPVFQDNLIDVESFEKLSEDDIKELVPMVGLRAKLRMRWKEFLINNSNIVIDKVEINLGANDAPEELNSSNISEFRELFSSTPGSSQIPVLATSINCATVDDNIKTYILGLLEKTNDGKEVFQTYRINNTVKRNLLVKIIIEKELESDPNARITKERFLDLSKAICTIFPCEFPGTYFVPACRDSTNKPISAQGKLWDKYMNSRRKYIKLDIIPRRRTCNIVPDQKSDVEVDEITGELVNWLVYNKQPWIKVEDYWGKTCSARLDKYHSENIQIHEYFQTYPALQSPLGYTLILRDFEILHPNSINHLFNKWSGLYKSIICLAKKKKCPVIDGLIQKYEYPDHLDESVVQHIQGNLALLVLPLLFPNTVRRKKGSKGIRKFSKVETQEAFLTHVEKEEDLTIVLEEREARKAEHGESEQPGIILVGKLENPKCLVKINDILYEVHSSISALDLCFKLYMVLNASYPESNYQCWTFIQTKLYEIHTNKDSSFIAVNTVYSDILRETNTD